MQTYISNFSTITLSRCITCRTLGGVFVIWLLLACSLHLGTYRYQDQQHHYMFTCAPMGSIQTYFWECWSEYARCLERHSISHVRTHDTCVFTSGTTAFPHTATNHTTSHPTSLKAIISLEMGAWKLILRRWASKRGPWGGKSSCLITQIYLVWSSLISANLALSYLTFGPLAGCRWQRKHWWRNAPCLDRRAKGRDHNALRFELFCDGAGYEFVPLAGECFGRLGKEAPCFLSDLGEIAASGGCALQYNFIQIV